MEEITVIWHQDTNIGDTVIDINSDPNLSQSSDMIRCEDDMILNERMECVDKFTKEVKQGKECPYYWFNGRKTYFDHNLENIEILQKNRQIC